MALYGAALIVGGWGSKVLVSTFNNWLQRRVHANQAKVSDGISKLLEGDAKKASEELSRHYRTCGSAFRGLTAGLVTASVAGRDAQKAARGNKESTSFDAVRFKHRQEVPLVLGFLPASFCYPPPMFGWGEILVVISIGVLVFGARKLPALGKSFRDTVIGFKKGIEGKEEGRPSRDVTPSTSDDSKSSKK